MTGDARADASDRGEQAEESENEREQDDPERDDPERDDPRPDHRKRADSEQELTGTREPMSEATTDTERPDESSTDLAIRRNLFRAALALFALLAVVAVLQLYGSVNATIDTFVASEYRPPFRAAFNLVVLLASGIGISWCVRELTGE